MLTLLATPAMAGVAQAQEAMKSDKIVEYFVESADLGKTRGICVGTAEECDAQAKPVAGLDMLINFDLDSAELTEQARASLDEFAKALKDDRLKVATFVVEGFTDATGTEVYNKTLSQRRAESVTAFLLSQGISNDRIKALGRGEDSPRVPDPFDPVNRRVEMRIEVQ